MWNHKDHRRFCHLVQKPLIYLILFRELRHFFVFCRGNACRNMFQHRIVFHIVLLSKMVLKYWIVASPISSFDFNNIPCSIIISAMWNFFLLPFTYDWKNIVFLSPSMNHFIPPFCLKKSSSNPRNFLNSVSSLLSSALCLLMVVYTIVPL